MLHMLNMFHFEPRHIYIYIYFDARTSIFACRSLILTRSAYQRRNSSVFSHYFALSGIATRDGFLVITADILGYNYESHERAASGGKKLAPLLDTKFAMVNVA